MTCITKLPIMFALNSFLAQDQYAPPNPPSPLVLVISLVVAVLMIAAMWKIFTKAGQPGWASIIPIVNTYFLCKVGGRPGWWLVLFFIPIVNLVVWIILCMDIAKAFGEGAGFGIGLLLLPFIFFPILGFGGATYQGGDPSLPQTI